MFTELTEELLNESDSTQAQRSTQRESRTYSGSCSCH